MVDPVEVSVAGLSVDLGPRRALSGVSFEVAAGRFVAVVGPNGSGKTTLLRAISGALAPALGVVRVGGADVRAMAPRARGQTLALLRQEDPLELDFLVEEVVLMGRSPYKRLLEGDGAEDLAIVRDALARTDAAALEGRVFTALSGGERQRVLLARALAQRPRLLLLDEPTNHLDIAHQLAILACVRQLGVTVIAALHDLNLALRFADEAVLLAAGEARAVGPVSAVLTEARVAEVFGVSAERLVARAGHAVLAFE